MTEYEKLIYKCAQVKGYAKKILRNSSFTKKEKLVVEWMIFKMELLVIEREMFENGVNNV